MKCGLVSLALLGVPASGCWLRNSADGKRTEVEGRNWAHRLPSTTQSLVAAEARKTDHAAKTVRAQRISGKRALTQACSEEVHFSECSQDKGSAVRLERCLRAKTGKRLSGSCQQGLQAWKQLLAETAADARNLKRKKTVGPKKAAPAFLHAERPLRDQAERHGGSSEALIIGGSEHEMDELLDFDAMVAVPAEMERDFSAAGHPPHRGHRGPPGGHRGMGPRHNHAHGPPDFDVEDVFLQHEERRPTMFSVLADWIFGDSSSSDSLDSSSDSWDSWDSASTSTGGRTVTSSDDGFNFPYHGIPPPENFLVEDRQERGGRGSNLRGRNIDVKLPLQRPQVERLHSRFSDEERGPGRAYVKGPSEVSEVAYKQAVDDDDLQFLADSTEDFGTLSYGEKEAESSSYGGGPDEISISSEPAEAVEVGFEFDLSEGELGILRAESESRRNDKMLARLNNGNKYDFAVPQLEPGWEVASEEGLALFAAGRPHAHSKKQHHHRGDHIRFRNRLPEDFEDSQREWLSSLSDSFDFDGDGPDLVEGLLAFFFFIGAFTLVLLPFMLLGRALKRLVRGSRDFGGGRVGGGGDAEAPDGYYALPEDAASSSSSSSAAGVVSAHDDDDSIVVTGTPVNPPPSVHL